jgi:FkbM family methyltransferase
MTLASRAAARVPERLLVRLTSLAYRRFEPEIRRLDQVCGRGGTMVDIGGWYGPWTRRLVRRASRVVVIEPTSLHEVLSRTLPPAVDVIAAAASDHCGEADMWLPSPEGAARGVSSLRRRDIHNASITVPLVTVDGLGLEDVRFVKIDVDGHEVPVLRGAAETIRRDQPRLLIEVEHRIQPTGNVTDLLESWGYRGWVLPASQWVPLTEFPLAAHQARTDHVADRGLLSRAMWPFPRYVNSVLFLPAGQAPLSTADMPIVGHVRGPPNHPIPQCSRNHWEHCATRGCFIFFHHIRNVGWVDAH